jgi:hypothetical protein
MSMQDYEDAKELVKELLKKTNGISTFVGPRPEALINLAQERLSVKFSETYHRFLLEYGAGGVGGVEFYGVVQEEFEQSGYPDVVWLTLKGRKEWSLPKFLIPVYDLGDGELFCLDLRSLESNEAKIVGFTLGYSSAEQHLDVVAEDFGKLFLVQIQLALRIRGRHEW